MGIGLCPDLMVSLSLRLPRGVGLRSSLAVEADGAGGRMRRRERSKPRRLQGSSSPKSRDDTGFPRNSCSPGAGKRGGGSRRARMRRRSRRRLSRPPMESVSHCRRRELRRRPRRSRRTRAPRRRASGAPIAAPCLRICRASRRLSTSRAKLARAVRAPARPIGNDDVLLEVCEASRPSQSGGHPSGRERRQHRRIARHVRMDFGPDARPLHEGR